MIVGDTGYIVLFNAFEIYVFLSFNNSPVMRFLMLKMNDHIQLIITIVIHYVNYITLLFTYANYLTETINID